MGLRARQRPALATRGKARARQASGRKRKVKKTRALDRPNEVSCHGAQKKGIRAGKRRSVGSRARRFYSPPFAPRNAEPAPSHTAQRLLSPFSGSGIDSVFAPRRGRKG